MTIVEFLEARIAEDEAVIPLLYDLAVGTGNNSGWYGKREAVSRRTIVYGQTKQRIERECAAKSDIVTNLRRLYENEDEDGYMACLEDVKRLALIYSDHPDYQPDWARE